MPTPQEKATFLLALGCSTKSDRFFLVNSLTASLIPWLIAQTLLRGLKTYGTRISVHFNGLDLLARNLSSGRVLSLTENGARSEDRIVSAIRDSRLRTRVHEHCDENSSSPIPHSLFKSSLPEGFDPFVLTKT